MHQIDLSKHFNFRYFYPSACGLEWRGCPGRVFVYIRVLLHIYGRSSGRIRLHHLRAALPQLRLWVYGVNDGCRVVGWTTNRRSDHDIYRNVFEFYSNKRINARMHCLEFTTDL